MDIERLKQDIEQEHKNFQTYEGRHDAYLYDLFKNAPTENVDKVLEKAKKLNAFYNLRSRKIIPRFWYKTLMVATASH